MKIKILSNIQIIIFSTLIFAGLFFFWSEDNYSFKKSLIRERDSLAMVVDSIKHSITIDSTIIKKIDTDTSFLKRYARENFFMLRKNEDVFIVD